MPVQALKIWFSNNPNLFLPLKNQTRLLKLRKNHPELMIHLLVDLERLGEEAQHDLRVFCEKYEILLSDLSSLKDSPNLTQEMQELQNRLIDAAKYEIEAWHAEFGNGAIPSDISRWLPTFQNAYYSDCDLEENTEEAIIESIQRNENELLLNVKRVSGLTRYNNDYFYIPTAYAFLRLVAINTILENFDKRFNSFSEQIFHHQQGIYWVEKCKWNQALKLPPSIRPSDDRKGAYTFFKGAIFPNTLKTECFISRRADYANFLSLTLDYAGPKIICKVMDQLQASLGLDKVGFELYISTHFLLGDLNNDAHSDISWCKVGKFGHRHNEYNPSDKKAVDALIKLAEKFYHTLTRTYIHNEKYKRHGVSLEQQDRILKNVYTFRNKIVDSLIDFLMEDQTDLNLDYLKQALSSPTIKGINIQRVLMRDGSSLPVTEGSMIKAQSQVH